MEQLRNIDGVLKTTVAQLGYAGIWVVAIRVMIKSQSIEKSLNAVMKSQENLLDERDSQKATKNLLGAYLKCVEADVLHLKRMDWPEFKDEVAQKAIFDWADLTAEISQFLSENLTNAEAAYYESASDFRHGPVVDGGAPAVLLDRLRQWQGLSEIMTHRSQKLRNIIEKLM